MNNIRRKEIGNIVSELEKIALQIEEAYDWVLQLKDEEDEYRDNIPENLQGGERYMVSEEASEYMEEASGTLDDLLENINDVIDSLENARV